MPTPLWSAGTLYQPGDLVRPTSSGAVDVPEPENPHFDEGETGWSYGGTGGSHTIDTASPVYNGTHSLKLGWTSNPNGTFISVTNDAFLPVAPGQIVTMRCYALSNIGGDVARLLPMIVWFDENEQEIGFDRLPLDPTIVGGEERVNSAGLTSAAASSVWVLLTVEGVAPINAAFWTPRVNAAWGDSNWTVDYFTWEYANQEAPNNNLYRAVQATAGFSGNIEPDWPLNVGNTVIDNEVTWECVAGTSVTWQAQRILVSGETEPTWPVIVNAAVADGTISWTLNSRRVTDTNAPQSEVVALIASKVFAADVDIMRYTATVNPLDWTTAEDAGYIPFGLNTYGGNPIAAAGIYRGNLAIFNSQGCQIWQVDEDPAAITILDALPFPCTYPKSLAPVGDDLAFLTSLGIRSLGVAGAQVNLQGGYFGKQVDPLVIEAIAEALEEGWTPRGLYWPAQGQYWLFFGAQAFVLSIEGDQRSQRSWSRYTFPWVIDAWTINGNDLYLRAGDLVELVDVTALNDDIHQSTGSITAGETDGGGIFLTVTGYMTQAYADSFGPIYDAIGTITDDSFSGYTIIALFGQSDNALRFVLEGPTTPPADAFESLNIETDLGTLTLLAAEAETQEESPGIRHWLWLTASPPFTNATTYDFLGPEVSTPFTSVIHWPYLDFKSFNRDKELIGFDLAIDGVCSVTFGWDQRFLDYDVAGPWTALHEVDGDTVPAMMIPFSLTGASFAMRLVFESGQNWRWYSSNLYAKDLAQ